MSSKPVFSISVPASEIEKTKAKLTSLLDDLAKMEHGTVSSRSALFRAAVNGRIVSDNGETYLKVRITGV